VKRKSGAMSLVPAAAAKNIKNVALINEQVSGWVESEIRTLKPET